MGSTFTLSFLYRRTLRLADRMISDQATSVRKQFGDVWKKPIAREPTQGKAIGRKSQFSLCLRQALNLLCCGGHQLLSVVLLVRSGGGSSGRGFGQGLARQHLIPHRRLI